VNVSDLSAIPALAAIHGDFSASSVIPIPVLNPQLPPGVPVKQSLKQSHLIPPHIRINPSAVPVTASSVLSYSLYPSTWRATMFLQMGQNLRNPFQLFLCQVL
jgi:hypothetical protein